MRVQLGNRMIRIMDIRSGDFDLSAIAGALAKTCRYAGNTKEHYSTAEHSVHLYNHMKSIDAPMQLRRAALMHDAPESIIGDIIRPVKSMISGFTEIEDHIYREMAVQFRLPIEIPHEVKEIDTRIIINETRALFPLCIDWGLDVEALPDTVIYNWTWRSAYYKFLSCAAECGLN